MSSERPSAWVRWVTFTRERFDPLSHLAMIGLFVVAHLAAARAVMPLAAATDTRAALLLLVGTTAFFFKLRLYDEIKDYEVDLVHNPGRPLARGLMRHRDLHTGIGVCIAVELFTFSAFGRAAVSALALAIAYSLAMYREFFIGAWLRRHLTTYAMTHTVVSCLLSLALCAATTGSGVLDVPTPLLRFSCSAFFLFNIFEIGRKTFTTHEERPGVESYSKIFGHTGAVVLVLLMAAAATGLLVSVAPRTSLLAGLGAADAVLLAAGCAYGLRPLGRMGKLYRGFSSLYIVLAYLVFSAAHLAALPSP